MALRRLNQGEHGDLGRGAEPQWRPPVAAAPVDVDPGAADLVEARDEGLLQAHGVLPGDELAAVSVTRQLQVAAGAAGRLYAARLVSEEDPHVGAVAACQGPGRVRLVAGDHLAGAEVGGPGHGEPSAAAVDVAHLVDQDVEAEAPGLGGPLLHARVVLVVAGAGIDPEGGGEPAQGRRVRGELFDGAVGEIAGEGDQVRLQLLDPGDEALHEGALDRWAHVEIADLDDAQPFQRGRQVGHRDIDPADRRSTPGLVVAKGRHAQGEGEGRQVDSRVEPGVDGGDQPQKQAPQIAQDQQRRGDDEEAHAQVGDPGEGIAEPGKAGTGAQAEEQKGQEEEEDQRRCRSGLSGERQVGDEAPARVGVDGGEQRQEEQHQHDRACLQAPVAVEARGSVPSSSTARYSR